MAAPMEDAADSQISTQKASKKCDFLSDEFDPLTALYSPDVPPVPSPEVKPLNNLDEYSRAVKGLTAEARRRKKEATAKKPSIKEPRQWDRIIKPELLPSEQSGDSSPSSSSYLIKGKRREKKDVFTMMEALSLDVGPLSILHKAMKERLQVKVWTRSAKQLRGYSVGFIVAFDKHWNLAMVDVDETYTRPSLPRTSYTLPKHVLMKMRREERLKAQALKDKTSSTDNTETQDQTLPSISKDSTESDGTKTDQKSECAATETEPSKSEEPQPAASISDTYIVPGVIGYGKDLSTRNVENCFRGREIKEKIPGLTGRIFVRHINQLFIRGDNICTVQLIS